MISSGGSSTLSRQGIFRRASENPAGSNSGFQPEPSGWHLASRALLPCGLGGLEAHWTAQAGSQSYIFNSLLMHVSPGEGFLAGSLEIFGLPGGHLAFTLCSMLSYGLVFFSL